MKDKIIPLLALVTMCAYPCLFIYFQNIGEGKFTDIFAPLFIYCAIAFLVVIVMNMILKQLHKAVMFSSVFMMIFMNFNLIYTGLEEVVGQFNVLILVAIYLVCLVALYWMIKRSKWDLSAWCDIVGIVFGVLILINFVFAMPDIINNLQSKKEVKLELEQNVKNTEFKENIYYLIFDEYAGTKCLEYYYDFDNKDFEEYLIETGFSYSRTSYNKESINTVDIVPNILNLNYVTEPDGSAINNIEYTKQPVLYRFFQEMGYQINMVNHMNTLNSEGCNLLEGKEQELEGRLIPYIIENSIIYNIIEGFNKQGAYEFNVESYAENLDKVLNSIKYSWKETDGKPTLTVGYVQCPHVGFVYNSKGEYQSQEDWNNWADKSNYKEQLLYLNEQIKEIVKEIQANDPNAIIVMQADHGARYGMHCMYLYDEEDYDADVETEKMQNVLNCVYWGSNEKVDIEGLSGINTWRTILNTLYGTEYEMLPEPEGYKVEWKKEWNIK